MTISSTAVDHHQPTCDALERSIPVLAGAMRRAPGDVRPTRMRWTNGEIAAHMYASVVELTKSALGEPSMYDGEASAELDERMVAQVHERDPAVLAGRLEEATAALLKTVRRSTGNEPLATPRPATIATIGALLVLDHHLHGGQFAETAGTTWRGEVRDLHHPVSVVLSYAFDPAAAAGYHGSFTLHLRGTAPVRYAVHDGRLELDVEGPTDCEIKADPQTFLRAGIGVVSPLRAALTGKVRPGGRKPWRAAAVDRLFPQIPHGGVAR